MFDVHAGYIVLASGAVTMFLRFLPFVAFGRKRPEFALHIWRRNTLLSIIAGTGVYMSLVQVIFA